MKTTPTIVLLAVFLSPAASASTVVPQQTGIAPAQSAIRPTVIGQAALVRRYTQDKRDLERFYGVQLDPQQRRRMRRFVADWRARLAGIDAAGLDREGKVDVALLQNDLDRTSHSLDTAEARAARLAGLLPFQGEILRLARERKATKAVDPSAAAETLDGLHAGMADLEAKVRERLGRDAADPLGPTDAKRAAEATQQLLREMEGYVAHYRPFHPEFAWWVAEPAEALSGSLRSYAKLLREEGAGLKGKPDDPLVGEPLGSAALAKELELELLPYDAEQLIELAEADMAWCAERMAEAAAELGLGSAAEALEHVRGLGAEPGGQDLLVKGQAKDAIEFLQERDLVSLEPLMLETITFDMLSTSAQRTLPFAAYGGQRMLVAYPTAEMDHGTKLMALGGNNEHFSRIVTPHELVPGHHLQRYMQSRHAEHRSPFSTPFFTEGWALYWEMLLWDEGWARGPEDRIGMLFWRMHRGARVLVLLGFHSGEMTPEDMVELLVERVGHEPYTARAEVRRYVGDAYGPIYPVGYLIGGLQLRELAAEVVGPGGMGRKAFHDALLKQGPIPVELVRAGMVE